MSSTEDDDEVVVIVDGEEEEDGADVEEVEEREEKVDDGEGRDEGDEDVITNGFDEDVRDALAVTGCLNWGKVVVDFCLILFTVSVISYRSHRRNMQRGEMCKMEVVYKVGQATSLAVAARISSLT